MRNNKLRNWPIAVCHC